MQQTVWCRMLTEIYREIVNFNCTICSCCSAWSRLYWKLRHGSHAHSTVNKDISLTDAGLHATAVLLLTSNNCHMTNENTPIRRLWSTTSHVAYVRQHIVLGPVHRLSVLNAQPAHLKLLTMHASEGDTDAMERDSRRVNHSTCYQTGLECCFLDVVNLRKCSL